MEAMHACIVAGAGGGEIKGDTWLEIPGKRAMHSCKDNYKR